MVISTVNSSASEALNLTADLFSTAKFLYSMIFPNLIYQWNWSYQEIKTTLWKGAHAEKKHISERTWKKEHMYLNRQLSRDREEKYGVNQLAT